MKKTKKNGKILQIIILNKFKLNLSYECEEIKRNKSKDRL